MDITPLFEFSDRSELRTWLEEHHGTAPFCWVATTRGKEPRKGAVPYLDLVEECLCFGWIDSTVKRLDEGRQAQRISPRKKGSTWTILNSRRLKDLEGRGLVTEAGLRAFREAGKKEFLAERDLLKILRLLDGLGVRYWVDGGWGVDILAGRRTRRHRDLDLDYDGRETGKLLSALTDAGFVVETDMMPVRMELHHQEMGYLDIHPFEFFPDGSARQADGQGGWYDFTPDLFGEAEFLGRTIPCNSHKGQFLFHTGYALRKKDIHDLDILSTIG